jgi:hypothetical protein
LTDEFANWRRAKKFHAENIKVAAAGSHLATMRETCVNEPLKDKEQRPQQSRPSPG